MTTQENGSVTATVVTTREESFLTDKLKLDKLLRSLATASKKAVEALETALNSQDEKVRVAAADKLLAFYVSTAKEVNNDQIQRLIAELKLNGGRGKRLIPLEHGGEGQSGRPRPVVDFETIRDV
jgi:hypothetical protein